MPKAKSSTKPTTAKRASAKTTSSMAITMPRLLGTLPIRYIGKKEQQVDDLYGTKIMWKPGEVHNVPFEPARHMLFHTDTYADARDDSERAAKPVTPLTPHDHRHDAEDYQEIPPAVPVHLLDADGLVRYAAVTYGERLDASRPVGDLRNDVVRLMHTREIYQ